MKVSCLEPFVAHSEADEVYSHRYISRTRSRHGEVANASDYPKNGSDFLGETGHQLPFPCPGVHWINER